MIRSRSWGHMRTSARDVASICGLLPVMRSAVPATDSPWSERIPASIAKAEGLLLVRAERGFTAGEVALAKALGEHHFEARWDCGSEPPPCVPHDCKSWPLDGEQAACAALIAFAEKVEAL